MINAKVARKIGEVLAFAQVGVDTIERGRTALIESLGAESIEQLMLNNQSHIAEINRIAGEAQLTEAVHGKANATSQKLSSMRHVYIQEEWDNSTELMEWSSFFQGAAIGHWELVLGAAQTIGHTQLEELAQQAIEFHHSFFHTVLDVLKSSGQEAAKLHA